VVTVGSAVSPQLTKLSFRRDVRLFLAFLVGLLVFMIAALLITFGRTAEFAAERTVVQWNKQMPPPMRCVLIL
jgi:hypothetical protein